MREIEARAADYWLRRFQAEEAALAAQTARAESYRAALPDPGKLWALAAWIDILYPGDPNPEVQRDLRAWSRAIVALDSEKYGKCSVPEVLAATVEAESRAGRPPQTGDS